MSWNSAGAYSKSSVDDLRETIGIPQFSGTNSENWAFVFNGMIFQGGVIEVPSAITAFDFHAPLTLQVLGVFLQPITSSVSPGVTATTLNTFTVDHTGVTHNCYWWAIGV